MIIRPLSLCALLALAACDNSGSNLPDDTGTEEPQGPDAPELLISPEAPRTTDNLMVEVIDPETNVRFEYQWSRDGEAQNDLTSVAVPTDRTAKGEIWEIAVTPFDTDDVAGTVALAEVEIQNTPPSVTAQWETTEPTADTGLAVTYETDDIDEDDVSIGWAWTLDGDPTAFDGPTVAGTELSDGQIWTVTLTPNDGDDDGEPVTLTTEVGNSAPTLDTVTLTPETAYTDTVLTAMASDPVDANGDEVTLRYDFYVGTTVAQSGAESTLSGENFVRGDVVYVEVVPSDGSLDGEPRRSDEITILNSVPVIEAVELGPDPAFTLSTLRAEAAAFDADGDELELTYTWTVNGDVVDPTGPTLDPSYTTKGDTVQVDAFASDGDSESETVLSSEIEVLNTPPTSPGASVSPNPAVVGEPITCTVTRESEDDDDDELTYSFSWTVNGDAFDGHSVTDLSSTVPGDAVKDGQDWVCSVEASDGTDSSDATEARTSTDAFQCAEEPHEGWDGSGSLDNPYIITDRDGLSAMRDEPSCAFILGDDIDLIGEDWEMIDVFSGDLDGDGYAIQNLTIDDEALLNQAFFYDLSGTVHDIDFVDANINVKQGGAIVTRNLIVDDDGNEGRVARVYISGTVTGARAMAGAIILVEPDTSVEDVLIEADIIWEARSGASPAWAAGAIHNLQGHAKHIVFNGEISIDNRSHLKAGGLVSTMRDGALLELSSSHGVITGSGTRIGGLVGEFGGSDGDLPLIRDCYTDIEIEGTQYIGGLIGDRTLRGAVVETTYSAATLADIATASGIAGFGSRTIETTDTYFDTTLAGTESAGSSVTGTTGYTTDDMLDVDTYEGFESPPWVFVDGEYPTLEDPE